MCNGLSEVERERPTQILRITGYSRIEGEGLGGEPRFPTMLEAGRRQHVARATVASTDTDPGRRFGKRASKVQISTLRNDIKAGPSDDISLLELAS
jgi:hypothetical protein